MSPLDPLEILQVIGYSIGALLPLWMLFQLVTHRSKLTNIERLLALLALTMGGWHTSNLVVTLHGLFDLGPDTWTTLLRFADTVAAELAGAASAHEAGAIGALPPSPSQSAHRSADGRREGHGERAGNAAMN